MKKHQANLEPYSDSFSEEDIQAVSRVIHSLEKMVAGAKPSTSPSTLQLIKLVKRIRAARNARADFFDANLFGEPAWDMLLALYQASAEQYRLKITDLINESSAKDTTALRWINRFEELGLATRKANPFDSRSHFIELNESTFVRLTAYLEKIWARHFPLD